MLEVKKYRLNTLSPLHIGNGNVYNSLEFVVFGKNVYFVSEEKMAEQLPTEVIDDFTSGIIAGNYNNLFEFLWKKNLCKEDILTKISTYVVSSDSVIENVREIREFVKEQKNFPYIPGSSIKGMFRTSFLYNCLKNKKDYLKEYVQRKFNDFWKDRNKDKRWFKRKFGKSFANSLETDLLKRFQIAPYSNRYDPHTDIFRCFRVSDSTLLQVNDLRISEIKLFSAGKGEKHWSIYAETLKTDTSTDFTISIDWYLFEKFKNKGKGRFSNDVIAKFEHFLNNPLEFLRDFSSDLLEIEGEFCRKNRLPEPSFTLSSGAIGRLGFGSGLLGVTVDMLLEKDQVKKIRDTFGQPREYDELIPKSRRLEKTDKILLGWLEISLLNQGGNR